MYTYTVYLHASMYTINMYCDLRGRIKENMEALHHVFVWAYIRANNAL